MSPREDEDPVQALRDLPGREPGADRSRAVLAAAARTIARRRRLAERRLLVMAAMYAGIAAPFAAGSLSAAYLAAIVVQAIIVFRYAGPGIF